MIDHYVSRGGLKLASVIPTLGVDFRDKTVLDVGSSTGGFSDYALKHGANKVVAIEKGTNQLHPSLIGDERLELHEKTDIRDLKKISMPVDIVVIDVSFVSLREILPTVARLVSSRCDIIAMVKPQFEAKDEDKHKGIIKNNKIRRDILKNFELWASGYFQLIKKSDSSLAGSGGNLERFYLLRKRGRE